MTKEEIIANQDLMTSLLADQEVTQKVIDNLKGNGMRIISSDDELDALTKSHAQELIDKGTRINHEIVEKAIFEASGIPKPPNTKAPIYAQLVFQELAEKKKDLEQQLQQLKEQSNQNPPKNKVAAEIENQQITVLQQEIEQLKQVNAQAQRQAFEATLATEINSLDLVMPKATQALFKSEFEQVEYEGKKVWKNIETGAFMLSKENAAPMAVSDIIKTTYPDAFKKEAVKKTGLGLESNQDIINDVKTDYTVQEAMEILAKRGITQYDRDSKTGDLIYDKLLQQMTASTFKKK